LFLIAGRIRPVSYRPFLRDLGLTEKDSPKYADGSMESELGFMEYLLTAFLLLLGGWIGYKIGRDAGFAKGRVRGCIMTLADIQRMPEKESKMLFDFTNRCFDARSASELMSIKFELLFDAVPVMADLARDMGASLTGPVDRATAHLLPKYRDILISEIDRLNHPPFWRTTFTGFGR
jgi:hypothetical protein